MAEDLIIARFQADITDYKSKLIQLETELNKLSESEKKTAEDQKKVSSELATASQKRTAALKNEEAELKRLQVALKQAFTAPEINKINGQINSVKSNISALKGETSGLGKVLGGLGSQFAAIGAGVAAAFSVQAIVSFATDSVKAFREAEVNANQLKFAITSIGDEGVDAFNRLIKQSAELQKISVFSDDDIQRAQKQLSQFGLTADQIELLIPKVLDLASATGTDLASATDTLIQGINGQTRALKPLGLEFKNTGDKAKNLEIISEKLNKFLGSTAVALETGAGQAKNFGNKIDDLKEKIGDFIDKTGVIQGLTNIFSNIVDSFQSASERAQLKQDALLKSRIQSFQQLNAAGRADFLAELQAEIDFEKKRLESAKDVNTIEAARVKLKIAGLINEQNEIKRVIAVEQGRGKNNLGKTEEQLAKEEAASQAAKQKELENQKKLQQEINKLSEENLKNQESLRQQFVKSQIDLINKESDARLLALSKEAKTEKEFNDAKKAEEIRNVNEQLNIQELNFEERSALLGKLNDLQISSNLDALKSSEQLAADQLKIDEDAAKKQQKLLDDRVEAEKKAAEERLKIEQAVQQEAFKLASEIIDAIFTTRQADLQRSQEAETAALENSRNKALASKRLTEAEKDRINNEFAAKEQALRKKQFEQVKRESTLEATIKGALAVVQALASAAPPYNYILAAAVAAATAVEIATIQSQKYAKGTKKAKGGMAMVGEIGAEFMYVPQDAKILPAKQTRQHSRLIDAMYDGHLDKMIHQDYILPALQKQKAGYEKKKEQTFSNNLAKSLIFNGLTGNEMERIRKRGTDINNIDELVEKLASAINKGNDIRRMK